MKNPPAFQFYPQDFISDLNVQSMTDDEIGKYTKLLCYCWIEDGLKVGSPLVAKWFNDHPVLARCFTRKGGKYRNPRLDREREKQHRWSEKSSRGGAQRAINKRITTKAQPRPNQIQPKPNQGAALQSSSSSIKEDKNKSFSPLADFLLDRVKVNVPFQKIPPNYQESWSNEFRLMVEVDKIPVERMRQVLDWATTDSFWKNQIRSAGNFRKQFGQLEAKSRSLKTPDIVARERRVGASLIKSDPRQSGEIDAAAERINGEYEEKIETAAAAGDKQGVKKLQEEARNKFEGEASAILAKYANPTREARP